MFSEKERGIFVFFDGKDKVRADPLPLLRRFQLLVKKSGRDLKTLIETIKRTDVNLDLAYEAHEVYLGIVRETFEIASVRDGGLTEIELTSLLNNFLIFLDDLKKSTETQQSSLISMVSPEDESTTRHIADSISTERGSKKSKRSRSQKDRA